MSGVTVTIEKLLEQEVDEISKAGEEKYIKPHTYSEELTYLSGKIDFYEGIEKEDLNKTDESKDDKEKPDKTAEVKQWHWDSVHSKLRIALSEVSVMLDVLLSLNKKKYLVLDPIQQNPEPSNQIVQMFEKRKYLARASAIISKGALTLRKEASKAIETVEKKSSENEYYEQLMHLRQYWHVKKVGNQISGNISYRNAGSNFWHPGLFEVEPSHDGPSDSIKKLTVNISPDLVSKSKLIIHVSDSTTKLCWSSNYPNKTASNDDDRNWNLKLKEAQSHLFIKELFAHLCNDAFQGSFIGVDILENKIICKILDGVTVVIENYVEDDKTNVTNDHIDDQNYPLDLELILNNLLLKSHSRNSKWHNPSPGTSNNYHKLSRSSSIYNLIHRKIQNNSSSMLKEFLDAVSFKIIVNRVKKYFEEKNLSNINPLLMVHWNSFNTSKMATVNITLQTNFEAQIIYKSLILFISDKEFTIICDDNSKYQVTPKIKKLNDIMDWCICVHLIDVSKLVSTQSGWKVMQCNSKFMIADDKQVNISASFYNAKKKQQISMKFLEENKVDLKISTGYPDIGDIDIEFQDMCLKFRRLSWNEIHGRLFIEKCKSLFIST